MLDNLNFTRDVLKNPLRLQQEVLEDMEARTKGNVFIADPNNPFIMSLDANASIVAGLASRQEKVVDDFYAIRADEIKDLYRHMSDYDYRDITASPAPLTISLYLSQNELRNKAKDFNEYYKRVIIPDTSVFTLGTRSFSLFYPIDIRINKRTGNFLVNFDASLKNPLHELSTNNIDYYTYTTNSLPTLQIDIPLHQFFKTVHEESFEKITGFNYAFSYTDKFMAARLFTTLDGELKELAYTLSEDVYDKKNPTARLKIFPDEKKIHISIPQIYSYSNLIGDDVITEIYTTEGMLDVPVTNNDVRDMSVTFLSSDEETSKYSSILNSLEFIIVFTSQSRIVGGSDGLEFEDIKKRVVYGSTARGEIPITPLDLENHVTDHGFHLTRDVDTITHRTFYANKKLLMTDGTPVPVTLGKIELDGNTVLDSPTIFGFPDNSITVLPTTIFNYNDVSGICQPLGLSAYQALSSLEADPDNFVLAMNNNFYTRQPFHLVVYTNDKYPHARSFNLLSPDISKQTINNVNSNATPQMNIVRSEILHKNSGTEGYTINLGITKQAFDNIPEDDIQILLYTRDISGSLVYKKLNFSQDTEVFSIYTVKITSSYQISDNGYIKVIMNASDTQEILTDIKLVSEFSCHMLVKNEHVAREARMILDETIISNNYPGYTELINQTMYITFGKDMSGAIENNTSVIWSSPQYATYQASEYDTYPEDVYTTDNNGVPIATVTGTPPNQTISFTVAHAKGSQKLDSDNNPIPKSIGGYPVVEGQTKRNSDGSPVILKDREKIYIITSLMFDGRLYASNDLEHQRYLDNFPSEFESYVDSVDKIESQLGEETDLYLQPVKTIGISTFSKGNNDHIRRDLGLGFSITYYVTKGVYSSPGLISTIRTTTRNILASHMNKEIISLSDITKNLKDVLRDNIMSIDAIGIKNTDGTQSNIQTLIPVEKNASPILAIRLDKNLDDTYSLIKDVDIDFKISE